MSPDRPLTLGEFVVLGDGRRGVLVAPRPGLGVLRGRLFAVWLGETADEDPIVELVDPQRLWRWESETDWPVYYH